MYGKGVKMKPSDIITIISAICGSGMISVFLSHILYNKKLTKEIHYKGKEKIAENILMALTEFRDLELMIKVYEIYDAENIFKDKAYRFKAFEGENIYPAIMNNAKALIDFQNKVIEIRIKYEKYLSCKVALNLIFIDKYIQQLIYFLNYHGGKERLHEWGLIFISDLQRWQRNIDKILVNEINKHTYELESHETRKYTFLFKKELLGQYENTILYSLIENKCKRKNKKKMRAIKDYIEECGFYDYK